jgi:hypothetical protein
VLTRRPRLSYWGGGEGDLENVSNCTEEKVGGIPVAFARDNVVDAELLTDFFDTQMKSVSFKLFGSHVGFDLGGQAHETCGLVVICITPSIALLASLDTVDGGFS